MKRGVEVTAGVWVGVHHGMRSCRFLPYLISLTLYDGVSGAPELA